MNVTFLSPLDVENLDAKSWRVNKDFRVAVDGVCYTVPHGFVTDFASVPRLPFAYYIAGGRAPKSATLHDWLYVNRTPRDYADNVLYYGMKAEGISAPIRWLMYRAVRAFGGTHYEKRR